MNYCYCYYIVNIFVLQLLLSLCWSSSNSSVAKLSSTEKWTRFDRDWESLSSDELERRRRVTYERMLSCARASKVVSESSYPFQRWEFPVDAEQHYQDLLKKTERYRHVPIHTHGHHGMWIGKAIPQNICGNDIYLFL